LASTIPLLFAPVGNLLHYRYGTRRTVFVGVMTLSLILVTLSFISEIRLLLLIFGLFGGIAQTLITNAPFILVAEYFPYEHPRHVLATSLVMSSFPLGKKISCQLFSRQSITLCLAFRIDQNTSSYIKSTMMDGHKPSPYVDNFSLHQ